MTTAGPTTAFVTSTPSVVTGTTKVPEITPITTPTLCICNVNGTIYRPGDTVYNVTDGLGWCYIAFCNASCKTDKRFNPCVTPSTTIPATTTVFIGTTPPPTPPPTIPPQFTTPPFTTALDCVHLDPPRKNGETWRTENCTTATCIEGNVEEMATICATPRPVVCANGREPVTVSEDGCCYEKQCECICSTWSKKHYRTFDGFKYVFKGQCSYYLVKEIVNKHAFNITVSNADCRTEDKKFCPQSLIITYGDYKIYLTHKINSFSVITNEVYINQKRIYPAFSNSVVRITNSNRVVKVMIPDIKTEIVFSPTLVLISLSSQIFSGKTEGLCGTCDNSQSNDCRSPNGQVGDCPTTSGEWTVPREPCGPPSTPVYPATTPAFTTPPTVTSPRYPTPTSRPPTPTLRPPTPTSGPPSPTLRPPTPTLRPPTPTLRPPTPTSGPPSPTLRPPTPTLRP
ncbi:mucin-2-like, partial [Synchiropus splendidus]|uniref:mucin-2-like n=1 Tax=Synchiropus splendidus TaxID=270530 RepID=UPI00237D3721